MAELEPQPETQEEDPQGIMSLVADRVMECLRELKIDADDAIDKMGWAIFRAVSELQIAWWSMRSPQDEQPKQ